MLRIRSCWLALLLILLCSGLGLAGQAVIWYLPHPDDETIGMADAIYQTVLAGNPNYFIYFTKGENSWARHRLEGPAGEKYSLTKEEFAKARVEETLAALAVLGVEPEQVQFLNCSDGSLPLATAEEVIREFAQQFPGALHRTVSPFDPHIDHQTLAQALVNVSGEEGIFLEAEFFRVYSYRKRRSPEAEKRPVLHPEVKTAALAQFEVFRPQVSRYAVGSFSTPDLLRNARERGFEYVDGLSAVKAYLQRPTVNVSSIDLGVFFPLKGPTQAAAFYDYKARSGLIGLSFALAHKIPLLRLKMGLGYHLRFKRAYLSSTAVLGPYFVKARHTAGRETKFAFGVQLLGN